MSLSEGDDFVDFFKDYDEGAEDAATIIANGGLMRSLMTAKETQKMAMYLIGRAEIRVVLTAYTFDLLFLTEGLIDASKRCVEVMVIFDKSHTQTGSTNLMAERVRELRAGGIKVLGANGPSRFHGTGNFPGIQHSKTVLTDDFLIIGSTNWTNASRRNTEMSALIELTNAGKLAHQAHLEHLLTGAKELTAGQIAAAQELRATRATAKVRAKSADTDKYATARKFSIARARSLERNMRALD